jgi:hypothetical protein
MNINKIIIGCLLLIASPAIAQMDISRVASKFGLVDGSTPYAEVEVGGKFFLPYFQWSGYGGYFHFSKEYPFYFGTSYDERIIGARITFLPVIADEHVPLPIEFFAGISQHFRNGSYYNSEDPENPTTDFTNIFNTGEIGANLSVNFRSIQFLFETEQFIKLETGIDNRMVYKIGLGYVF